MGFSQTEKTYINGVGKIDFIHYLSQESEVIYMGGKLLWTGVTIDGLSLAFPFPAALIVGAVFLIIGCVLMWLDK